MIFRKKIIYLLLILGSCYLSDKLTAAANVYQRQLSPYPDNPPLDSSSGNHDLDINPNSNSLQYPDHHELSDTESYRFRRNSNDSFASSVELLLKASRVINGIALQQGLSTGTITPDALISDLLNLDSATSIKSINADDFQPLLKEIKELPQKLVTDAGIENMEERFLIYSDAIDGTEGMEKGVTIPRLDEYLKAIDGLSKTAPIGDVRSLGLLLGSLNTLKTSQGAAPTATNTNFFSLRTNIDEIKNLPLEPLKVDDVLRDPKSAFEPLLAVNAIIQKFVVGTSKLAYDNTNDPPVMRKVGSNVQVLEAFSKSASSLKSKIENLHQIFAGRLHQSGNRKLSCTAGFTDGISDLGLVSNDLKDEWVKGAVDEHSDSLAKALDQLGPLQLNTQTAASSLQLTDGEKSSLSGLTNLIASASQYDVSLNELSTSIEKFFIDGTVNSMKPANWQQFQPVLNNIKILPEHLQAVTQVKEIASAIVKDKDGDVSTILDIIKDSTVANANSKLDDLRKSHAFENLRILLESGAKSYEVLTKKDKNGNAPKSVIDLAQEIEKNKTEIQTYIDGLGPFLQEIDTLRKIPGSKNLGAAIRAIQEHRKSTASVPDVQHISRWVKTAKTTLSSLENSVKEMAEMKSAEKNALASLNSTLQDSQTIGSAAQVFRGMKMILETSVDLDDVEMEKVRKYLVGVSDPQEKKNLEDLMALDQKISTLKQEINQVKASIRSPKSPDFIALHEVIQTAKGLSGIPLDFFAIGKSVEKMSEQLKDKNLLKLKKALDQLDTFGLDFARHKTAIGASKAALDNVDLLFVAYGKTMHKPSKKVTTQGKPPSNATTIPFFGSLEDKSDYEKVIYISLGATAGAIIIAALIVVLICWRCPMGCCRERVVYKDDPTVLPPVGPVREDTKPDPAPAPTPGPPAPAEQPAPTGLSDPPPPKQPARELEEEPTQLEHPVANITPLQAEEVSVSVNNCTARYSTLLQENFFGKLQPVEFWLLFVYTRYKTDLENLPATSKEVLAMQEYHRKNVPKGLYGIFSGKDWPLFAEGWIHANMITYFNRFRMVLSQAPQTENSTRKCNIGHFWSAVRSRGSNMVICLTKFMEGNDEKCSPYFPLTQGTTETYANGIVTITCISVTTSFNGELTIRMLRVTIGTGQPFTVRHLHYTGWPDFEIPTRTDVVLAIYQEIIDRGNTPFVHCTAGLGRSGVLAQLVGNMISFESRGYHLDQTTVLNEIRHFRPGAIQTPAQLWFAAVLTIEVVRIRVGDAMTAKALKIYNKLIGPAKEYLVKGVTDATFKAIDAKLTSKKHMTDKQRAEEVEKQYKQTVLELKAAQAPPPLSASNSSNMLSVTDNNETDIQMLEQEVSAMRTASSDINVAGPSRLSREAPSQQKSRKSKTPDTKEKKKKGGRKKKAAAEAGMTVAESLGTQPSDTNLKKM